MEATVSRLVRQRRAHAKCLELTVSIGPGHPLRPLYHHSTSAVPNSKRLCSSRDPDCPRKQFIISSSIRECLLIELEK